MIQRIYSACGYRITHGLAPQSTETEPVARKSFKEFFYHGILLGILGYKNNWRVSSNKESGNGFSDILIETADSDIGIVIEVKYSDNVL